MACRRIIYSGCLVLAACASSAPLASQQVPVERAPPAQAATKPVEPSAPKPEPAAEQAPPPPDSEAEVAAVDPDAPLGDPMGARRYGYPPGTILRFSLPLSPGRFLFPCRSIVPLPPDRVRERRNLCFDPASRLLVFRTCGDDGTCRDEVVIREPGASPSSLTPVRAFTNETGLVEALKYTCPSAREPGDAKETHRPGRRAVQATCKDGVFEFTLERGSERMFFHWPTPP